MERVRLKLQSRVEFEPYELGAVEQCYDPVRVDLADDGCLACVVVDDTCVGIKFNYVLAVASDLDRPSSHQLSDGVLALESTPAASSRL